MKRPVSKSMSLLLVAVAALVLAGCRGEDTGNAAEPPQPEQVGGLESPGPGALPGVGSNPSTGTEVAEDAPASPTQVAAAAGQLRDRLRTLAGVWSLPLHHGTLVEALYRQSEGRLRLLTADGTPSAHGRALLDALRALPSHALDPADFHLPRIEANLGQLDTAQDAETRGRLRDEAELLLADALLAYGHTLRWGNPAIADNAQRRAHGDARLVRQAMLEGFADALEAEDPAAFLAGLAPQFPQYARLQAALERYRSLAAAGSWPVIEPPPRANAKKLKKGEKEDKRLLREGDSGPAVEALERRLAAEGYFTGPVDGQFDRELTRALIAYQKTHQLSEDGDIEPADLESLNKPVEMRVAEIEVALERWRESRIGNDQTYIHVNLPDFHAELHHEGKLVHRFRVIVGNGARYFDEVRKEYAYINNTPLISAEMDFIIFNPWWNVTPRVAREIDADVAKNPKYLEENGFIVEGSGSSRRYRQKPGPKNALGQVKFQFPNRHDIYMHDTNNRHLFRHEVRAFSHGCIRVEDPLLFAEHLLRVDKRPGARSRVEQYLKSGDQDWTELKNGTIPVHIEYIGVRVDDQGGVHFGADIYRYDRPRVLARMRANGWSGAETPEG